MARYQLQGQSRELNGDWSTEYITQEGDEAATFDTFEEAENEMRRLISEYSGETVVSEDEFRIIEIVDNTLKANIVEFTAAEYDSFSGGEQGRYTFTGYKLQTGEVCVPHESTNDEWFATVDDVEACGTDRIESFEVSDTIVTFTLSELVTSVTGSAREFGQSAIPKSLHKYNLGGEYFDVEANGDAFADEIEQVVGEATIEDLTGDLTDGDIAAEMGTDTSYRQALCKLAEREVKHRVDASLGKTSTAFESAVLR